MVFDISKPKTKEPTYIEFTLDGDTFQASPNVGQSLIDDLMDLKDFEGLTDLDPEEATIQDTMRLMKANHDYNLRLVQFLDAVLTEDSAALYANRLRMTGERSIERWQSQGVVRHLIEEYSKPHPTVPPSPITNGHGGTGLSLTDGAPASG